MNLNLINEMVAAGYISRGEHPDGGLYIYNYTAKAQYDRMWNEATLMCRGLILNEAGEIVARPMGKFFNIEEMSRSDIAFSKPFKLYEKVDGSLGILYEGPNGFAIATRGSFMSDQALRGTDILHKKYPEFVAACEASSHLNGGNMGETWLFEIIYPGNRIVIDYGDMEDLILLGVIDNKTGRDKYDVEDCDWPGPRVRCYN